MAGLKKSKRNKDTTGPNLVLVLFLIMFVISNIIFGLWLYFSYDEKNRAVDAAVKASKVKQVDKDAIEFYQIIADDLRQALGQKPEDVGALDLKRKELFTENSRYAKLGEKNFDVYKKLIEMLHKDKDLAFDETSGEYTKTYAAETQKAIKEAQDSLASLKKTQKELKESQDRFKTLAEKQDTYFTDTSDKIDKTAQLVVKAAGNQTDEMAKQIALNGKLIKDLDDADKNRAQVEKKYQIKIKELEFALAEKDKERPDAGAARSGGEPHALLLDVSLGKPLWDDKVGTIKRVDAKAKEVTISVGSASGVRPDLTFNVFAPSRYIAERGEGQLKGTIEVVRVLGPHTSIARITAEFDPKFPMNEGDLLYNMFWGTRVAVTGYVDVMGPRSDSPSEQMRQLQDFMYLLSRQGIIVDAYLDLTDGQVKGAITQNTRYLIKGDDIRESKDPEKDAAAARAVAINNGILAMRKDAIEKGLFVISAKNFATVIGYHPAGSNPKDDTAFRPGLPYAGALAPALNAAPVARPEPAAPEPKKDEPKEKEKEKDKGGG